MNNIKGKIILGLTALGMLTLYVLSFDFYRDKAVANKIKIIFASIIVFFIAAILYFFLPKTQITEIKTVQKEEINNESVFKKENKVTTKKIHKKRVTLKPKEQKIKKQLQQKWLEISKTTKVEKRIFWQNLKSYELEKFIKAGVYVKVRYADRLTPLHFAAAYNKDTDVIKLLVKTGAKINAKALYDATPLHYASGFNSDEDIIKTLIKLGADVNAKDLEGRTPLHWIVKFAQNVKVIDVLLNSKVDINKKDIYGRTALNIIKDNRELSKRDREKVSRWLRRK
jgi:ankyrin repeat protein